MLGSGTLEVRDVRAATDMGWYTCMAHGYDGTNVTAAAYLTVIGMCTQLCNV